MKKLFVLALVLTLSAALVACGTGSNGDTGNESLEGTYVGYSWRGESNGTSFEDANQYIETILELDEGGVIQDAKMRFFVMVDGYWTTRQSGNAFVEVDFSQEPTLAVPGENYEEGNSMFTIYTADMMSFYAVAANEDGTVAAVIVDPITRYQMEMKITPDFDLTTPVSELTIGNEMMVPTVRTSGSGLERPSDWSEYEDKNIFDMSYWSHVVNDEGILAEIDGSSTTQEFLEALGVEFTDGKAEPKAVEYGYFGLGGWKGNFEAIENALVGKNATEFTSLVDWSNPRYAGAVNDDNIFGVDVETGATRTVQNSIDTISGATVRISREATSYQRALVNAGILSEEDVVVGRF